jgi:2'-hydroxyisoflavone reductase
MRLLVLGGTKFLGRAAVDAALARGHEVTLFNRGETNPGLFPEAEKLRGDRDGDLRALEGRRWDSVIDPSGFVPRVVRASAELLAAGGVEHYVFVSSISAYSELPRDYDESTPLAELEDPASEEVMRDYGALKVACERVVEEAFRGRSAVIRAGLIVGPHDPTDRFTYWPVRLARGGEVLAPAPPDQPWQFVDARDLGTWLVHACEERVTGPFNATGPAGGTTAAEVLEACRVAAGSDATLTWVDEGFLREQDVGEWMELPLWVAPGGDDSHVHTADIRRALEAGLETRPVDETVRETLSWASSREGPGTGTAAMGTTEGVGLDPEKERRLLAEWRARISE